MLTLPLTSIPSSGLQVKDFVMLQQAAELEELQLQPQNITISMRRVCSKVPFFLG